MDILNEQHDIPRHWMPAVEEMSALAAIGDLRYREVFDTLASGSFVREIAGTRLTAMCDVGERGIARERAAYGTWVLYTDHTLTLALGITSAPDGVNVDTVISNTSLAVVGPGRLMVERFRTTVPDEESDIFRDDHLLEALGAFELSAGRSMHLEAERDIVRIAECTQPVPILSMNLHHSSARLCWHYDVQTRRAFGYTHADPEASQTTFLLGVIADQRRTDHLGFVTDALAHASHGVRWAAIKALWVLDPERALDATRVCLADRHPHVRRAAAATMQMFERQQQLQPQGAGRCL